MLPLTTQEASDWAPRRCCRKTQNLQDLLEATAEATKRWSSPDFSLTALSQIRARKGQVGHHGESMVGCGTGCKPRKPGSGHPWPALG